MRIKTVFLIAPEPPASKLGFMKRFIFTLGVVGLLGFLTLTAGAFEDEYPRAQSLFAKGQRLIRSGDYPGAIDAYKELVAGFKNSNYRDIYNYALARAYYLSGDHQNAASVLNSYHTLFPASPLTPYAYHLWGNAAYRLRQLEKAFLSYASAYRHADDSRLRLVS